MNVSDLDDADLARRLRQGCLFLETGPFISRIQTSIESVQAGIALLYAGFPVHDNAPFADFHVALTRPAGLRRWFRPQVNFLFDGWTPFKPLPLEQAFAMFEWGMNWCVVNHAHKYLVLHAAVVEKGGRALIMPAPPGAGKSTLCAALVASGWRLLSDELAIISPDSGQLLPLPRPVGLKNASIEVIRTRYPDIAIGQEALDTAKGTVAHMKPPGDSVASQQLMAMPGWVLFPRYREGSALVLEPFSRAATLSRLVGNAFNFTVLGRPAFECLSRLVDDSGCYSLEYSSLDEALERLDKLEVSAS